jgi:hypothetical protein
MAQDMFNPAPPPQGGNGGSFAQKMPMRPQPNMAQPTGMRPPMSRPSPMMNRPQMGQMGQGMNRPMNRMGQRPPMGMQRPQGALNNMAVGGMQMANRMGIGPRPPQTIGQPQQIGQMAAPPMQPGGGWAPPQLPEGFNINSAPPPVMQQPMGDPNEAPEEVMGAEEMARYGGGGIGPSPQMGGNMFDAMNQKNRNFNY